MPGVACWCKDNIGGGHEIRTRKRLLPAIRNHFLIGLALCAGMLSGCQSSRLDSAFQPSANANYAYAGDAGVVLPDEVAVLPSSFAGPSPSEGSYEVASLPPADIGEGLFETEPQAEVEAEPEIEIVYAKPDTPRGEVDRLIAKYADIYEVPEALVRRVVKRESNFNPRARNHVYWGLMQIRHDTARGMGYKGNANGLLDAETNLDLRGEISARGLSRRRRQPRPRGALLRQRLLLRRQASGPARRDRARQGPPPQAGLSTGGFAALARG